MWRSFLSLLKRKRKRRRRRRRRSKGGRRKKKKETVSYPKPVAPLEFTLLHNHPELDDSDLDDELIREIYWPKPVPDHDWEKHSTFDIEISLVIILKMMISILLVLSMF